jgi:hypothetical protein
MPETMYAEKLGPGSEHFPSPEAQTGAAAKQQRSHFSIGRRQSCSNAFSAVEVAAVETNGPQLAIPFSLSGAQRDSLQTFCPCTCQASPYLSQLLPCRPLIIGRHYPSQISSRDSPRILSYPCASRTSPTKNSQVCVTKTTPSPAVSAMTGF